jgi:predicted exporter
MFELLSLIFGGVLRLLPEVLKLFTAKADAEHEYRMTQLQLEIDKARSEQQIDLVHAQGAIAADTAEMSAMVEALKAQSTPSGVPWIDALSSSVRPVLTYWWCLALYTAYKAITVAVAVQAGTTLGALATLLVTEFDRMVIGSIFSFWFVDRSLRRGKL